MLGFPIIPNLFLILNLNLLCLKEFFFVFWVTLSLAKTAAYLVKTAAYMVKTAAYLIKPAAYLVKIAAYLVKTAAYL